MNLSELHDSYLIGLSVDREKRAQVTFELAGGRRAILILEDVEHLLANDFREGNIVLDILIQNSADYDERYLDQLFGKEYLAQNKAFKQSLGGKISCGELILVTVEPSYGCALIALCKSSSWVET